MSNPVVITGKFLATPAEICADLDTCETSGIWRVNNTTLNTPPGITNNTGNIVMVMAYDTAACQQVYFNRQAGPKMLTRISVAHKFGAWNEVIMNPADTTSKTLSEGDCMMVRSASGDIRWVPMENRYRPKILSGVSLADVTTPGIYSIWRCTDMPSGLGNEAVYIMEVYHENSGQGRLWQRITAPSMIAVRVSASGSDPITYGAWSAIRAS